MRGKPAAAEAGVALQQLEVCLCSPGEVVPGSRGPWQWRAAQTPSRGGVDSDLCLHTGFLVAAAALAFHVCLWCLR